VSAQASTLVILGAGGHGRVVADAALQQGAWDRVVATDGDPARCGGELLPGVQLLPLEEARALGARFHVAIGRAQAREREVLMWQGHEMPPVIHPRATVSPFAHVGAASFVAAQAVLAPSARVGVSVIVNHAAVIDHDCEVGGFTHVAPQAALGGGAKIGARVLIGAGARVLPGLSICDDVTVGAGAVVVQSITEPGVYAGVPARRIR
jgi:sugar O-acyltransferase (sialic acid O-acetyltransferase NeuD family)